MRAAHCYACFALVLCMYNVLLYINLASIFNYVKAKYVGQTIRIDKICDESTMISYVNMYTVVN